MKLNFKFHFVITALWCCSILGQSLKVCAVDALTRQFEEGIKFEVQVPKSHEYIQNVVHCDLGNPQAPLFGMVNIRYRTLQNQSEYFVMVSVRAWKPIVKTSRDVSKGEFLSVDNVLLVVSEVSNLTPGSFFESLEEIKGLRARVRIPRGNWLQPYQTEFPWPVEAGQMVRVLVRRNSLNIQSQAKALQSGQLSQWIRVENLSSKKILLARITGTSEVELP